MLTHGDLCTGIGGFALAASWMGWTTKWVSEIDPYCVRRLAQRFPHAPNVGDLTTADWSLWPRVDVLTAGFPCQPVSYAGKRLAQDDDRWLWPDVARAVRDLRPRYVVLENVPGLLTRGMGDVLGGLAALGYDAEWEVRSAASVGAPHERERVWIVAHADGVRCSGPWACRASVRPTPDAYRQADRLVHAVREGALPFVCGGHDGLSPRVDESAVAALGNAVVPQVVMAGPFAVVARMERERQAVEDAA